MSKKQEDETPVYFTSQELMHLKMLMGKDIGWQKKYGTGKTILAQSIYGKISNTIEINAPSNEK